MEERALRPFRSFRWIVADPELLGGKLAIRGTRFSVSFILSCMAEGMSVQEIEETYGRLPHEALPEVMRVASEILDAAVCGCLRECAEAGPHPSRRVWDRSPRRRRQGLGRSHQWRIGGSGEPGRLPRGPDARSPIQRVSRACLAAFPEFCVVLVAIPQLRGPEFLNRFRDAWSRAPILPVPGRLLHWPAG